MSSSKTKYIGVIQPTEIPLKAPQKPNLFLSSFWPLDHFFPSHMRTPVCIAVFPPKWVESQKDKKFHSVLAEATHDHRARKYPYPHDRRADKDSYPHDRNVTDDLCSLIELWFAFMHLLWLIFRLNVFYCYSCWKSFTLKSAWII